MKKIILSIVSVLAIVAGCTKYDVEKAAGFRFTATMADLGTKAEFVYGGSTSNNYQRWQKGDKIRFIQNEKDAIEATLCSGAGERKAIFVSESLPQGDFLAVYPNNINTFFEDDTLFVYFPPELTYNSTTGNIDGGGNIMIAIASGDEIVFHNFCSFLHFNITGTSEQKVSKLVLKANHSGDFMSGRVNIEDPSESLGSWDISWSRRLASKTLTINFPEPVALSGTGLPLNVPVCSNLNNYSSFDVAIYLEDGTTKMTKTSTTTWGFNEVIDFPTIQFVADKQ